MATAKSRSPSAPPALPRLILLLQVQAEGPRGLLSIRWESRTDLHALAKDGLAVFKADGDGDRLWNLTPLGVERLRQAPESVRLRAEGEILVRELRKIAKRLEQALRAKSDTPERANLEALIGLGRLTGDRAALRERCSELRRMAWDAMEQKDLEARQGFLSVLRQRATTTDQGSASAEAA